MTLRAAPPYLFLLFLALTYLSSACDDDLEPRELFIRLELDIAPTQQGDSLIGQVELSATISDWQFAQITDHGFLWTKEGATPSLSFFAGIESLRVRNISEGNTFNYTVTDLDPTSTYNFVAYLTIESRTYYSEVKSSFTNTGQAFTDSIFYRGGFELTTYGHLSGTARGLVALQHGFCWSAVNSAPTLDDQFIDLGIRRDDNSFSATIGGLEDGKTYYIRSFARLSYDLAEEPRIVYGTPLVFGGDLNFWRQAATWPVNNPRRFPAHFVIDDELYLASGFNLVHPSANFLWKFSPDEPGPDPQLPGKWKNLEVPFPGSNRGFYGFTINGKGYMGGGYDKATQKTDFYEFDPATMKFTEVAPPPVEISSNNCTADRGHRDAGFSFSINSKGYIGLGVLDDSDCSGRPRLFDVWEFDPEGQTGSLPGKWTRKGDYPGNFQHFTHPVYFVIGDKGYVVGGDNGTHRFIVEFDPEAGAIDPQTGIREGQWTPKEPLPDGPRERIAGFAIGDKAYLGLGKYAWFRSDFWEFDPEGGRIDSASGRPKGKWTRKADFPGTVRIDAFGFALGDRGYVGFGTHPTGYGISDFYVFSP